jgi:hypothetical protein
MHREREVFQWRAPVPSHLDQNGRVAGNRNSRLDERAAFGNQSLWCLESFVQIVPRFAGNSLDEIARTPIRNR